MNVFNYSSLLLINSPASITETFTTGWQHVSPPFQDRNIKWRRLETVGSLGGSSSIDYNMTKEKHTKIHTHSHTHSIAIILTLSGDEVVGSMVALKAEGDDMES